MIHARRMAGILVAAVALAVGGAGPQTVRAQGVPAEMSWPVPTVENRLWSRWWWMGNAVDAPNLTKQLEMFQKAGLGGVEICPIYGVYGVENRYVDFLSPKWTSMLSHTVRETKRLGMGIDMTTGTGWPFGGNMVPDADASKGVVFKSFDHYPATNELPAGKLVCMVVISKDGTSKDVTAAKVEAAAGDRFLAGVQTGPQQKVKRPAPGAEGNVLDPYSVESLNRYLEVFDKALAGIPGDMPRGQFHDSFEYYNSNWTQNLFEEFQKRRGYDLRTQWAAMNNEGDKELIARVKCDYRETLSDLHLEYMNRWVAWSHTHGGIGRNQAHGGPGNILDVYANADIPECEIFHLYDESHLPFLTLSSSAAHLTGKRLASAESFTWLDEHFNASLAQVKPAADFLLLAGVNHMFLHGIPYSPEDAAWPGWNFYASVNFGPYGGIWRDFPAFTAYVARCQSILQANKPSNDVLLYVPFHQFWSDPANNDKLAIQFTTPGPWMKPYPYYADATALWENGYGYDQVSDKLLMNAKVNAHGGIELGGNAYRTIIIPKTAQIPVGTLRQLMELARQGATVAFEGGIPTDVPGLGDLANRQKEVKQLAEVSLQTEKPGVSSAKLGQGKVIAFNNLVAALGVAAGEGEPMVHDGLRFIRRARTDGYDYFIVNRSDKAVENVRIGMKSKSVLVLDPLVDNRTGIGAVSAAGDSVKLHVSPGEAFFLRTFTDRAVTGPAWHNTTPAASMALVGNWDVTFIDGGPNLPKSFSTLKLDSWTTLGDDEAKRFAGTARYTLNFDAPAGRADDYQLDLGKVGDSARVTLNGQALGTLWSEPFTMHVGSAIKAGRNKLEIEVTNVAANRIADMDRRGVQWKIFRDANVLSTGYTAFDASKWPLRASGLMGPVKLVPLKNN